VEGAPAAKAEALIQADKAEALSPEKKIPSEKGISLFSFSFSINFLDEIQFSWSVDY
jgi:hypothetical protein